MVAFIIPVSTLLVRSTCMAAFNKASKLSLALNPINHKPNVKSVIMLNSNSVQLNSNCPQVGLSIQPLSPDILERAKIAYSCRRVVFEPSMTIVSGKIAPRAGDLVLANVDALGQHRHIERNDGRRANLFPGDKIIVCYGNRYAPDQFEAEIPENIDSCSLVAAGGMASQVISQHATMSIATAITPIGLIGNAKGEPINIKQWALPALEQQNHKPHTIAVLGTSMNSGKTTSAAYLICGLVRAGFTVGAAKITGTGSPNDSSFMRDAGAYPVFDFTDAGHPSTYHLSNTEIETILSTLTDHLATYKVDIIVLEIADGLFQRETEALCLSGLFSKTVDGIIFAAGDAMGASFGAEWLKRQGLPLQGLSGLFTVSPLAILETKKYLNLPVFNTNELSSAEIADELGLGKLRTT